MKKLIMLIFFIIFIYSTKGQNSFLDSLNIWNIGTHYLHDGPFQPYNYWKTAFLHVEGDTVINEKRYYKLWECSDSLCIAEFLKAYIREDSGRIFLADKTEEVLQYDFNLLQGDTMVMDLLREDSRLYLIQIDSIEHVIMQDQSKRIVQYVTVSDYYYREYSFNDIFVEGIGSLKFGLLYPFNLFVTGDHYMTPYLLCFYTDKILVYNNPEFNDCYITTGINQVQLKPELVSVFSAQNGTLVVELTSSVSGKIFVFNALGELVSRKQILDSTSIICMPCAGVYLYRFVTNDGRIQTGKVFIK